MLRQSTHWTLPLSVIAVVLGVLAFLRAGEITLLNRASAEARDPAGAHLDQSNPAYAYARLVFTVGGTGVTAWIDTPAAAVTSSFSKDSSSLSTIFDAIRATSPSSNFPEVTNLTDMAIVQWMGAAQWELVAVTQNQVDIGVTTSYYFRRRN